MIEFIEKRDGTVVEFNKQKIVNAIIPAMKEANMIDYQYAIDIANKILNKDGVDIAKVEDIQDEVERELMKRYPETAKRYIIYREERNKIRNKKSELMQQVKKKIYASDVKNDNANVDERCFGARKNEAAGIIMKKIAVEEMLSDDIKKAWEDNLLYIHDLDFYMLGTHNCLNVDEAKLLRNGFNTRNGDVRGAKRLSTAMQLIAIIMQTNENNLFGGIGDIHIDRTLAPFVRMSFIAHYKDGLNYVSKDKKKTWDKFLEKYGKEIIDTASISGTVNIFKDFHTGAYEFAMDMLDREGTQSAEALYHNLNTLESRPGLQLPFSSINFGLDTSFEGRFITKKL
jgi:ribonucleoside-triphosphate reductase